MMIDHSFALNRNGARSGDARSIGSIINGLGEVTALRKNAWRTATLTISAAASAMAHPPRLRALRRKSA